MYDLRKPDGTGRFTSVDEAMRHARWAFHCAKKEQSSIPLDPSNEAVQLLTIHGMSGYMYRHLLNNLCSRQGITYGEVGTWNGSTWLSAIYNNPHITAWTCDNWSEFGGPRDQFIENYKVVGRWKGQADIFKNSNHNSHEEDFRKLDFGIHGPIDIYFFDGPHSREDQKDGIVLAWDALAPISIVLVDDWNLQKARDGTYMAFDQVGANIHMQVEVHTPPDGWVACDWSKQTKTRFETSEWHNGAAMFVVSK